MTIFDRLRGISSAEAADHIGLQLISKGSRKWACCPIHGEQTPSMCFFPDGHWYCFGCHEHGDAITLYQKLGRGATPFEAATALANDFGVSVDGIEYKPAPSYHTLRNSLERYRTDKYRQLSRMSKALADAIESEAQNLSIDSQENYEQFESLSLAKIRIDEQIEQIKDLPLKDLAILYVEEVERNAL